MREKLAREERDVEKLQMQLCEAQERDGGSAIRLHKSLAKHVQDMHRWKDLLDYDREFLSTDIHIKMEDQLTRNKAPEETFGDIEVEFNKEVALLAKLFETPKDQPTSALASSNAEVDHSAKKPVNSANNNNNQESQSESSEDRSDRSSTASTQESSATPESSTESSESSPSPSSSSSSSPVVTKKYRKSKK